MINGSDASRYAELERRMRAIEEEAEGEKAVTRYVLTQARFNSDDLLVMKGILTHVSDDMLMVKTTQQNHGTRLNGLTQDVTLLRQDVTHLRRDMEELRVHIDAKFDAVDARFEAMDRRFETMDRRFEAIERRFEAMERSIGAVLEAVRAQGARGAESGA